MIGRPEDLFGEMVAALLRRTEMPRFDDPASFLASNDDRRYPAAFVVALCGEAHPQYVLAKHVLAGPAALPSFLRDALHRIRDELRSAVVDSPGLRGALLAAASVDDVEDANDAQDRVWAVTFPEGVGVARNWVARGAELQERRRLNSTQPNPMPLTDPIASMLVTANVVIAPPDSGSDPDFWFDHPIPLDAEPAATELAHGLRLLNEAVGFELERHPEWRGPLSVVLSISTTRDGYSSPARDLVGKAVASIGPVPNLRVFAFDEIAVRRLWDAAIRPVVADPANTVFGVEGSYGRHYSFLKAIAALWSVLIDDEVRATFKIDLDQAFPQERLVAGTGQSAFEHFMTPHWGASAIGGDGADLDLALIAGGLVNQADIGVSIRTPDVTPGDVATPEDVIFFSRLPQALSTEFEIGATRVIERVHVTGGTNGILVAGLRRWRLFTPSVIGRAEDQAYLLSGLEDMANRPAYVHEPGLIMRHDKTDLVPDVIKASAGSKHIGDLLRMRLFSAYADTGHKAWLDPFSGCFVTRLPLTVTSLRFALHALSLESSEVATGYLREGTKRLADSGPTVAALEDTVCSERKGWTDFYDALDRIEEGVERGGERFAKLVAAAKTVVSEAELTR
ncbi:MAG: hypothetical protein GY788_04300 [bacterium]|nr:hypothetical protein [bacterium]